MLQFGFQFKDKVVEQMKIIGGSHWCLDNSENGQYEMKEVKDAPIKTRTLGTTSEQPLQQNANLKIVPEEYYRVSD